MDKIEKMKNWNVNDPWFEGALGAKVNEIIDSHNELMKRLERMDNRVGERRLSMDTIIE